MWQQQGQPSLKGLECQQEAITYNLTLQYSVRWAGKVACRGKSRVYSGGKDCRSFGQGGQYAITAAERVAATLQNNVTGHKNGERLKQEGRAAKQ